MHKTTKKDFEKFRGFVHKYLKEFSLEFWDVYIHHEKLKLGVDANITLRILDSVASINLNTESFSSITNELLDTWAKHEVIHILIGRMTELGKARLVTEDEFHAAEEELVRRLVKLI